MYDTTNRPNKKRAKTKLGKNINRNIYLFSMRNEAGYVCILVYTSLYETLNHRLNKVPRWGYTWPIW